MLSDQQREEFQRAGFVRIPGAFTQGEAGAMCDIVWDLLEEKFRVRRDDPDSWRIPYASGMQMLRGNPVFAPIGGKETTEAIDGLLGEKRWKRPKHWGQFLISFPTREARWVVPHHLWHTDFSFQGPPNETFGVLLFIFLSEVPPGAGGTAVVEGSPRVVRRFLRTVPAKRLGNMKQVRLALMDSDPWLRALTSEETEDRIERFMGSHHDLDGIPVRVSELWGEAGDIIMGHPWLLHASTTPCGAEPRIMRAHRINRTG
jgi:hypothetical protein